MVDRGKRRVAGAPNELVFSEGYPSKHPETGWRGRGTGGVRGGKARREARRLFSPFGIVDSARYSWHGLSAVGALSRWTPDATAAAAVRAGRSVTPTTTANEGVVVIFLAL